MCSVCGETPLARSRARCSTPKRCCSSMITSPRRSKSTPSVSSACVPTATARLTAGDLVACGSCERAALTAEDRLERDAERQEQRREFGRVLRGENLGRRHQRRLHAVARRQHDRRGGDERLAAADVALQQTVHRHVARHVVPDFENRPALRAGERERKRPPRTLRAGRAGCAVRRASWSRSRSAAAQLRRRRQRQETPRRRSARARARLPPASAARARRDRLRRSEP